MLARCLQQAAPALVGLAVFGLLRLFPTLASELEERVLLQTASRLGAMLGLAPEMAEDLRLVVVDDASMAKLDHGLTFAGATKIAQRLFDAGFEKVLISGVWVENHGELPDLAGSGGRTLGIGSVAYPAGASSTLARATGDFSTSVFLSAMAAVDLKATDRVLVPQLASSGEVLKLGLLNAESEYRVPAALKVGEGRIVPHLSLLASQSFQKHPGEWLRVLGEAKLYVDFHPMSSVVKAATPLARIPDAGKLPKGLHGGKVALLVPDGHTGGRFVSSPFGTMPSYVALASLVSSAMKNELIVSPRGAWLFLLIGVGAMLVLVRFQKSMKGLAGGVALVASFFVIALYASIVQKRLLPGAETALTMFSVWLAGSLQLSFQSFAQKMKLNFELAMGHDVQKLFLTEKSEWTHGRWRVRVDHKPFGALSGDWFQVFIPEQRGSFAVVALGDVVGKGTSAALITAAIAAIWNGVRDEWEKGRVDVHAFLRNLDAVIKRSFNKQQYSTLSLAVLLPNEAILASCASLHWLAIDQGGKTSVVKTKAASPVGLGDHQDFVHATTQRSMKRGDFLLACTDGLIDGLRAREIFRKRLTARAASDPLTLATLSDEAWRPLPRDHAPLADDATLILLEYT